MQYIDADLNRVLWDKAHQRPENVRVFGVRGHTFYLVEKSASILDRIFALFLWVIGSLRTDEKRINDLYARSIELLPKKEDDTDLLKKINELREMVSFIAEEKNGEIAQLEAELLEWGSECKKLQERVLKKEEHIANQKILLSDKENAIAELLQQIENLKVPLTPKSFDEVKEEQIKILKQRLERLKDPAQADFSKNMLEAFKNNRDKFVEIFQKPVIVDNERLPFIDHILKSTKEGKVD